MSRKPPMVDVIVLNYNGKRFLDACLRSIEAISYDNFNVTVVDNASTDGSSEFVESNFPHVRLVLNSRNLGFAGGNNVGSTLARGEYLFFLGSDHEVDQHALQHLVAVAENDSSVGICTAKNVKKADGGSARRRLIDAAGLEVDVYGFPYAREYNMEDHPEEVREVFSACGGGLFIRSRIFRRIGGFDSRYFLLNEDIDLSWRTRLLGFKVVYVPQAVLLHKWKGSVSSSSEYTQQSYRSRVRYLSERNALCTLLKNYSNLTLLKILPRYFSLLLSEFVFFITMRRMKIALAYVKAVAWNLKNLRETWQKRVLIQSLRTISDQEIQKSMIQNSLKILNFMHPDFDKFFFLNPEFEKHKDQFVLPRQYLPR